MRKVKILPLLVFFSVMIVFVACGIDLGPESSNEKVLREHAEGLIWDLRLTCKYQEKCEAKITPFVTLGNRHVNMGYDRYEYEFDDGMTKKIVTMNTTVPVTVDDDDHVRFSLFDSARVEKTYDIDLSEIIHSYTVKDDSVEIKMPEGSQVNLYLKDSIVELFEQKIPEGLYSFSVSTPFDKYYYFDYSIVYETEMLSDVINVYGRIYWRE